MRSGHRILHCLRAPVGGLFRHVRDLATAQAARGHEVGVICDSNAGDPLTEDRLAAFAGHLELGLHRVAMSREVGAADVTAYRAVRRIAATCAADVLHGHGAKGGAYARLVARSLTRAGHPTAAFYTPHGGSLHYRPTTLKGRLFMAAERYFATLTDGLIFESAYARDVFAAHVGPPACAVRVIHNGLVPAELDEVAQGPDAADFVFVGELRHLKGVDLLIEAIARLAASKPVRLVVVGAGPDAETFQRQARQLGVGDHVTFAGAMPARQAFRLGRTLVMPSRAESLPYVALEAAGAGLPLIATAVGGCPEIVVGTDTRLVAPDDVAALTTAMQEVLDDPAAAKLRAARLRAAITSRFSASEMAASVLEFYDAACRPRPRPLRQEVNA